MAQDELLDWIRDGLKKGRMKDDLTRALKEAGHTDAQIQRAFDEATSEKAQHKGRSILPGVVAAVVVIAIVAAFAINSDLLGRREKTFAEGERLTKGGINLFQTGDYTGAETSFREALEKNPDDATAMNYLGWILLEKGGDLSEIETLFARAADIRPSNAWHHLGLGTALLKEGKNAEAEQAFSAARDTDPTNAHSYFGLAVVSLRKGDTAGAQQLFDEGRSLSSEERLRSALESWPELEALMS